MFEVTFDNSVKTMQTFGELWAALRLDPIEYTDCCAGILMALLEFNEINLSAAYFGHFVKVRLLAEEDE